MSRKKKFKRTNVPAIPQLSIQALDDVQNIERYARQELRDCEHTAHFNRHKAERILRTCAVQALKVQLNYYESLPTFHEKWVIKLQENTIESAVGRIPDGYSDELYEHFRDVLWETTYADLNPPKKPSDKKPVSRIAMKESYLARFPGAGILDICWAAHQHYREWKRWIKQELKDGSKPDREFRAVLSSNKRPDELRNEPRPPGWS